MAIANSGPKQKWGRSAFWALVIASNITDIDVFGGFFTHADSFLYRRMLTHSVIGIPLLSAAGAWIFHRFQRGKPWRLFFAFFLLGTSLHVFFDLLNSYGVVIFYPINRIRYELSWVFIIDLVIWALLLAPLLASLIPACRPYLKQFSVGSLIGLTLYVGFCGLSHWRASRLLQQWSHQHGGVSFSIVFPEALGPHRYRGIALAQDVYHSFLIYTLTGKMETIAKIDTVSENPEVTRIKETEEAHNLEWFFKAPVWKRGDEPDEWIVYDLRFQSAVLKRGTPFAHHFKVTKDKVVYLD